MKYVQLDSVLDNVKTWVEQENVSNRKHFILEGIRNLPVEEIYQAEIIEMDIDGYVCHGCSHCHKTIKDYFSYCPYCGAKLR